MDSTTQSSVTMDVYELITNRIIELLERGTVPWQKPWVEAGFPKNLITKRPYRGINIWLLQSLGYAQNLFLTFEQLKSVGGSVNRGEKSHIVVFWKPEFRHKSATATTEYILRYYRVFNVAQCHSIPEAVHEKPLSIEHDPIADCEHIITHMPRCPVIVHKKQKAFYNVEQDTINMPKRNTFTSIESYYSTLFHEIVHSTGHTSRLNRDTLAETSKFGDERYSMEELVAELGTTYLCSHGGILPAEIINSTAYIKGWLNVLRGDKQFIVTASTQAQKAVEYILNIKRDAE